MGLVACDQCRQLIAENAPHCPHCGAPREEELSLRSIFKSIRNMNSTRTNLPLFIGALAGVLAVLGLHVVFDPPNTRIDYLTLSWQVALGAMVGCLIGAGVRRGL